MWATNSGVQEPVFLFSATTRGSYVDTRTSSVLGSAPFAGNFDGDGFDDLFWYKAN